jgi:hypothetical protein
VAHAVACELVLHLRRPGSQSQFSVPLWSAQPSSDPIRAAVAAVQPSEYRTRFRSTPMREIA